MADEVHIGDIGTLYKIRVRDEGGDFDPSSAAEKKLLFKLPVHGVIEVDADVLAEGSPATAWYLAYTVTEVEIGSPSAPFHAAAGNVSLQGRLTYADERTWSSDVQKTDDDGRVLKIYPNLDS